MPSQSYDEDGWDYFFFLAVYFGLGTKWFGCQFRSAPRGRSSEVEVGANTASFHNDVEKSAYHKIDGQGSSMLYCLSMAWDELEWNFPVILLSYFKIGAVKKHSVEGD